MREAGEEVRLEEEKGAVPRAEAAETQKWGRNMGGKTLSQLQRSVPKLI